MIEQLNKTLARISLLGLLMNSKPHRALLVKILNEAHVAQDISVEGFGGIVNNITPKTKATLDKLPWSTLDKLPFNASHLRPSSMVVWAFDGSRWEVRGEIDLPIQIGPHVCQITFQVMDVNPAYSCLLGRPWIHLVGVVPLTLHQKLKFVVEG